MTGEKSAPDWGAVRAEYLRAQESIREIAEWHGISDAAIRKRAKKESWPARPKQVRKAVECEPRVRTTPAARPATPEAAAEAADPSAIADNARRLVSRMLDELDSVTANVGELEDMIEQACAGDQNTKRRDSMLKAISLGGRAATLKELSTALKTLGEASAPQSKKAAAQDRAMEAGGLFRALGPPTLKVVS